MRRVVLGFVLAVPSVMLSALPAFAQKADEKTPASHSAGKILGSVGVAGMFSRQYSLSQASGGQYNVTGTVQKFAGWTATAEANVRKRIGVQVDFLKLYNTESDPSMSKFGVFVGPRYTFNPRWKATPFVFGEAGEIRTTYGPVAGHPGADWNPAAKAGVGFDVKLSRSFAFQAMPAEWMGERFDASGHWQNSYQARAGFVFYLQK